MDILHTRANILFLRIPIADHGFNDADAQASQPAGEVILPIIGQCVRAEGSWYERFRFAQGNACK
jgi:hypothetical protein